MSVWSVLNNSVTAEICLKVSPTTPGDCEKVVVIRVFHKLHFAKKKMQYQYAPLTGVYKPDMKEFFS